MKYKRITLVDNLVKGRNLKGEHGLSIYIEVEYSNSNQRFNILFDTGQSSLFAENADRMGINIGDIDYLVLSHGHSDHSGGLRHFLSINKKAKVICKSKSLWHKYHWERENGVENVESLDLNRFIFIDNLTTGIRESEKHDYIEIVPGVYVLRQIPIVYPVDTHFVDFYTKPTASITSKISTDNAAGNAAGSATDVINENSMDSAKEVFKDEFLDELALILTPSTTHQSDESKDGVELSIISACSHRGITNIVEAAKNQFPNIKIKEVVGGFHIHSASKACVNHIVEYFKTVQPSKIFTGHCTGVEKYAILNRELGDVVEYNILCPQK